VGLVGPPNVPQSICAGAYLRCRHFLPTPAFSRLHGTQVREDTLRLQGRPTGCCSLRGSTNSSPTSYDTIRRISTDFSRPKWSAISVRILFRVPTRNALCRGIVTWCSPSGDIRASLRWLPVCLVGSYPNCRNLLTRSSPLRSRGILIPR
jgi:hypothetical protein